MDREKLQKMSDLDLKQVKENATNRGRLDIAEICDELLTTRKSAKMSNRNAVAEFHFVCRKGMNLYPFADGLFKSGQWVVAEEHYEPSKLFGSLVCLHEDKTKPSYFQGKIVDYEKVFDQLANRWRVVFTICPTEEPLPWYGEAAGEKGYKYA